jgi:hypothetical protein
MSKEQKYIWLALLALGLGLWLCKGQPVPKKPAQVLHSPKDTPDRVLAWITTHTNRFYLAWDDPCNPQPVGYVIEYKTDLVMPWFPLGYVTNTFRFPANSYRETTNKQEFFRVGAFWP